MMIAAFVPVLLSLAPTAEPGVRIEMHSYAFGKRYSVVITQTALDKAPVWKDDADNPPLSARKAMKLAGAMKDKLVKDTNDWEWKQDSASLYEASTGKWYWLVNYEANFKKGGATGIPASLRLVVLMDGTVIEPKVTNDP